MEELGMLPGVQHIQTQPDAKPAIMANHRVPIAVRGKLKGELSRSVRLRAITPVEQPTPCLSQLVITVNTNGQLRVCLDPYELNKVLPKTVHN